MIGAVNVTRRVLRSGIFPIHKARHIGLVARLLPAVHGIYRKIISWVINVLGTILYIGASFIIRISAQGIGQRKAQVQPFVVQHVRQTARHFRVNRLIRNGLRLTGTLRQAPVYNHRTVFLRYFLVTVIHGLTCIRIYPGVFFYVEGVVGQSYFVNEPCALDWLLQLSVEWHNLVLVVAQIEDCGPVKVVIGKVDGTQFQFHTPVIQLSHIAQVVRKSGGGTDRKAVQQILRIAVIVFHAQENAVDERHVQSHVQVIVLFPSQVGVGDRRFIRTQTSHIALSQRIQSHIAIQRAWLVTVHTVRGTNLQIAQNVLHRLHERFVAHMPHTRYGPEISPAVIGWKTGTTVAAEASCHIITVVIIVVQTWNIRQHTIILRWWNEAVQHCSVIRFSKPYIRRQFGTFAGCLIRLVAFHFIRSQDIQVVLLRKGLHVIHRSRRNQLPIFDESFGGLCIGTALRSCRTQRIVVARVLLDGIIIA